MAEIIFGFGILLSGSLAIYIAVREHQKKVDKLAEIEAKCSRVVSLSDEVIKELKSTDNAHIELILSRLDNKPRYSSFWLEIALTKSPYIELEINNSSSYEECYPSLSEIRSSRRSTNSTETKYSVLDDYAAIAI